jgi:hypothetical protein
LALNVWGIKSKLLFPEFVDLITKYDIVCLVESKLADTDKVDISGYTAFYKNREKYRHKSGGILILTY